MEYILSVEASQDIENILDYFLQRNIDAGEKFVKDFNNKCLNIVKFPKIGRSYSHIDSPLRGIPIDGYIIFYQLLENSIVIIRVVSGYRDIESLFLDLDQ
ncbi:type II toxin-antitoxin system RelE/ParE family toxin [Dolichospermum sp. UHCC 0684]|jgi:toxin ParE1/3/4|uniref:type II toxin-antitoxin system RelE/ParE family toxin n=1 Tax=Nostocales TaxID=1161 RepID=UPI0011E64B2A|nr:MULTISPECIES: type II toxin-antitoxin system RelE/ParE family toxin [Nostocales]MCE2697306.1 type II toxin-antitoxin system RelE/ParE family toxin [Anabaena sp. 49633_E8]MDJ0499953.1 type II toxin-antitoxin system RelE/ParE family toxin [Nostocales cyanobacterium LE14-WE4]MCE2701877.1 type II toxin-antitoxin system RelE/ParE family toxin [Anabaena sp. 49633_E8]MDB9437393.1 type II toxin-antitoxin system RelE/ParE family toxin [Dolichospermum lemmermannii CS-548]MDB9448961.1 type II toxin-an